MLGGTWSRLEEEHSLTPLNTLSSRTLPPMAKWTPYPQRAVQYLITFPGWPQQLALKQCSGSGSSDPYLWLMDPDSALFFSNLQDDNKKLFFSLSFYANPFLKIHLNPSWRQKVINKSQNNRNQGFSSFFCLLMEGSGSGSGSTQINYGCGYGSRRPNNIQILWIRIRKTALNTSQELGISG
jgi:hypothetical protein